MRCGLYGKLPAKRDFVAVAAPRGFLRLWEPWLEAGLAAGRGGGAAGEWTAAFHSAPIWRFWLGPRLCGEPLAGAVTPSVDALGRMYPLTLVAAPCGDAAPEPPDVDPRPRWFAAVEAFLLDALEPDAPFEATLARLERICAAAPGEAEACAAAPFAALRGADPECPADAATFWWTIGGADCPPHAMMLRGMPEPAAFAEMISRRRSPRPAAAPEAAAEAGAPPA